MKRLLMGFALLAGAIAVCVALLNTAACYAADKIELICSDEDNSYSLLIDLEQKVVSVGIDGTHDFPIGYISDSKIVFATNVLDDPYWKGELNRVTGSFHFLRRYREDRRNYILQCKPAKPLF
jgi:hypothetical protein